MRTNLKLLRVKHYMTQEEFAASVDISRTAYASIEQGNSNGTRRFWVNVQNEYGIRDADMWELMKNDAE